MLAPLAGNVDDAVMRPIPHSNEALKLLTTYVGLLQEDDALTTRELRHLIVAHVHDLVASTLGVTSDAAALAEGRDVGAARLRAIKVDIMENLDRRDLTVAAVAARQGVTPRQVQRLLETEDTTFSEFVLGQRLRRAHRSLVDPRFADHAIGTIAYEVGFSDPSYFNRTFRRRYGAAPSDVRKAAFRRDRSSTIEPTDGSG